MFKILQKTLTTGIATVAYPDVPAVVSGQFRGRPEFHFASWRDARPAAEACPTGAIVLHDDVEEVYHSAREREPGRRTAFLAGACKDDEDLRREVESLLAEDPSITCFLEEPVMRQASGLVASQQSSSECRFAPGLELGPYIIEARLGAGGMGEVYRAKDKRLHRTVALKVLPQRLADTPGLRQRL